MSSIFGKTQGFGKRQAGGTVAERKMVKQKMVQAIVKKLKADGKPIDLQAIHKEVLGKCSRKRQK
ncbi:MAG: hypothetical protein COV72_00685 [Candidatus Omnitrophica bacterium CG11_big_fil_rev_8_21_14_0_20_42_13]|uniref:Uncharacterized protein n=1 Tax=Candidatus Ghiorseimicrobium undicola TaxID=1974746 RepID=A0A2H0LZS9_9BACT|nr:MAG: hypothetical protein COV72_00685 [Candidatus Omnitrophica bacterium CG11_big_fil_rev_8_21_14_0_20_42_13]